MKKEVKTFKQIYGSYIDKDFVVKVRDLSEEAHTRAKLNRNEQVYKDMHSVNVIHSSEAVDFWASINNASKQWLREYAPQVGFRTRAILVIRNLFGGK